jgi:hypothetical protein
MNRGERRIAQAAGEDVVEADHRDLLRHPDAGSGQGPEHPDGHLVVRADHRVREVPAGHGGQRFPRLIPAVHVEGALERAGEPAARVCAQRILQAGAPLVGVGGVGRPCHEEQAAPAVVADEMRGERGAA